MSKAMQLVGIILLGIFTLTIIYLMSDVRSTSELDYYLLQEVTEASMYDSIDYSYYRETGLLKVDRDMFLENFNRRFAESVDADRDYNIKIIDFNETPPKVSVEVSAPSVASVNSEVAIITNQVSGIIETIYDDYIYAKGNYGLKEVDNEQPVIDLKYNNGTFTIKMTDNFVLAKYAIVDLGSATTTQFAPRDYNNISNWTNIDGFVNKKTITYSLPSGNAGVWIVVADRAGLWKAAPITDLFPEISSFAYQNNRTELDVMLKDDRGLKSYTVSTASCSGNANVLDTGEVTSCSTGWVVGSGTEKAISNATYDKENLRYYKEVRKIDVSKANYYAITVKDTAGKTYTRYFEGVKSATVEECQINKVWTFDYTGNIQNFSVPCSGTYKLEVWGAQGGKYAQGVWNQEFSASDGLGGYSYGNINLTAGNNLYIGVGGAGLNEHSKVNKDLRGGYNGGGGGQYGGGGATHIATKTGVLSSLESSKSDILIVAGGGGGNGRYGSAEPSGGAGGGLKGNDGYYYENRDGKGGGGSQTAGGSGGAWEDEDAEGWWDDKSIGASKGSFGQGSRGRGNTGGGGGGGYYGGGGAACENGSSCGGGGGSGYLSNNISSGKMESGKRSGNGYAKITLISSSTSTPTRTYDAVESCDDACNCKHGRGEGSGHCRYDESVGLDVDWIEVDCKYTCPDGGTLNGKTCVVQ